MPLKLRNLRSSLVAECSAPAARLLKPGNLRGPLVAELTASTAHMKTHNRRGPLVAELTAPTARLEAYNRHALLVAELTAPKARFQGSRTRRGLLVAERSTATARFWGSPLGPRLWGSQSPRSVRCRTLRSDCLLLGLASGPRNHAICSLPNSSPRLHASWDSQPPAARSLPNLRRDRKLSGVATAAACSSPNTPPRPPNLRAAIANELPVSERSAATSATHRCRFAASCSPHCTRQRGASGVGSASRQS